MNDKSKEVYMYALGAIVVLSSFVISAILIFVKIPDNSHDIVVLAVGQLFTLAGLVVGYYFGSSKSSSDKTLASNDMMDKISSILAKAGVSLPTATVENATNTNLSEVKQ